MTVQVWNFNKSKKMLQDALNNTPALVQFFDPSIFNERHFHGGEIARDSGFPVVMDHPKRTRFASVVRKADGSFKVS